MFFFLQSGPQTVHTFDFFTAPQKAKLQYTSMIGSKYYVRKYIYFQIP